MNISYNYVYNILTYFDHVWIVGMGIATPPPLNTWIWSSKKCKSMQTKKNERLIDLQSCAMDRQGWQK